MLLFENQFVNQLPGDVSLDKRPRKTRNACYSLVMPTPTKAPKLVAVSKDLAEQFGLFNTDVNSDWFLQIMSGNQVDEGMQPYAMCYGGHQFGHWAGQLGDGRAINLGDVVDDQGIWQTLQLKGAGMTPYSRNADGLAVLRSSIREFLCSEAMYHLGVPTTRALSLCLTGDKVVRDMFYDGRAKREPGAVVCRVAPTFLRFGNFQLHAARNELDILKQLLDFSIREYFPHLGKPCVETYQQWFEQICQSTCELMVHWMRVGFVHGVMNTDNMSILGLTIDYGPYGWIDGFDLDWTPNTTDAEGKRYAYGKQPEIAQWNLLQLANAIYTLTGDPKPLQESLENYQTQYHKDYHKMMADKLGLLNFNPKTDVKLLEDLIKLFEVSETDMTIFFRILANVSTAQSYSDYELVNLFESAYYQIDEFKSKVQKPLIKWLRDYLARLVQQGRENFERKQAMNSVNPKYVLRNYLSQIAIDKAEQGDFSEIETLLKIIKKPYDEQNDFHFYAAKRPEWARNKAGCSMLSCSS